MTVRIVQIQSRPTSKISAVYHFIN